MLRCKSWGCAATACPEEPVGCTVLLPEPVCPEATHALCLHNVLGGFAWTPHPQGAAVHKH